MKAQDETARIQNEIADIHRRMSILARRVHLAEGTRRATLMAEHEKLADRVQMVYTKLDRVGQRGTPNEVEEPTQDQPTTLSPICVALQNERARIVGRIAAIELMRLRSKQLPAHYVEELDGLERVQLLLQEEWLLLGCAEQLIG